MTSFRTEKQNSSFYGPAYHILTIFFLCLGLAGVILLTASVPEIVISAPVLITISSGLITALYISNYFAKPLFYAVIAAIVLFCVFYTLSDRELFAAQWQFLFGGMVISPGEDAVSIDRVALVLTVFFSLLLFFFDVLTRLHVISFFITTALMIIPSVFGYSFPAYAIIPIVIYQLALFVLPLSFKRSVTKSEKMQQRIRVKSTLLTVGAALIALAIATPIAMGTKEKTFDDIARMENSALNNLGLSPFSLLYNDEGNVNRGDNDLKGVIALRLSADRSPTEAIYLRGYFGGNYYGDYWDANTDNVIFDALARSPKYSGDANALSGLYYALRYKVTTKNNGSDSKASNVNIRNLNINRSVIFTPYNASERKDDGGSYDFSFYEYKDLNMPISDSDPEELLSFRQLFRDYYSDAYDNYTYVTAESIPLLKELVRDNPLDDLQDITDFIIKTLDEHAEYTLTPGKAPDGVDTVDYFLFEHHKGYCQQFASAAVLMYRLYGIPARYATGFRVRPEDFAANQAGDRYEATVTDQRAHAWPEILIPEYGWVPVEVTPGSNMGITGNSLSGANDSFSSGEPPTAPSTEATEAVTEPEFEDDMDSSNTPLDDPSGPNDSDNSDNAESDSMSVKVTPGMILPWLIPLIAAAAAAGLYFMIRKRSISDERVTFEKVYRKLGLLLKNAPVRVTCNLSDKELPEQMMKAVPTLKKEDARAAYDIILEGLYSKEGTTEEHTRQLNRIYTKCADDIMPRIPAGKRSVLKYIKMLG